MKTTCIPASHVAAALRIFNRLEQIAGREYSAGRCAEARMLWKIIGASQYQFTGLGLYFGDLGANL